MASIITVPLYSIDECDGMNKSLLQKTFKEAIKRMYRKNGMCIVCDRQMNYDLCGYSLNSLNSKNVYVFGMLYDTQKGRESFGTTYPYLLDWFDEIEQQGFDHFVYNHRLNRMMALNEEKCVVLSDRVFCNMTLGKVMRNYGTEKTQLLSEPVFKPICANSDDYDYVVLSKVLNDIRLNPSKFQGFASYSSVYYTDGTVEFSGVEKQYVFDDCVVDKDVLRRMFADNRLILKQINADKGQAMILDSYNKRVYSLLENSQLIRRRYLRKWLSND